jgi:hypothetical protein
MRQREDEASRTRAGFQPRAPPPAPSAATTTAAPLFATPTALHHRRETPPELPIQPPALAPFQQPAYGYGAPVAGGGDPGLFYRYPEGNRGLMSMEQYIKDVRAQIPGFCQGRWPCCRRSGTTRAGSGARMVWIRY